MDRGVWWATVYEVAKSRRQLKRLSTHTGGKPVTKIEVWMPYLKGKVRQGRHEAT